MYKVVIGLLVSFVMCFACVSKDSIAYAVDPDYTVYKICVSPTFDEGNQNVVVRPSHIDTSGHTPDWAQFDGCEPVLNYEETNCPHELTFRATNKDLSFIKINNELTLTPDDNEKYFLIDELGHKVFKYSVHAMAHEMALHYRDITPDKSMEELKQLALDVFKKSGLQISYQFSDRPDGEGWRDFTHISLYPKEQASPCTGSINIQYGEQWDVRDPKYLFDINWHSSDPDVYVDKLILGTSNVAVEIKQDYIMSYSMCFEQVKDMLAVRYMDEHKVEHKQAEDTIVKALVGNGLIIKYTFACKVSPPTEDQIPIYLGNKLAYITPCHICVSDESGTAGQKFSTSYSIKPANKYDSFTKNDVYKAGEKDVCGNYNTTLDFRLADYQHFWISDEAFMNMMTGSGVELMAVAGIDYATYCSLCAAAAKLAEETAGWIIWNMTTFEYVCGTSLLLDTVIALNVFSILAAGVITYGFIDALCEDTYQIHRVNTVGFDEKGIYVNYQGCKQWDQGLEFVFVVYDKDNHQHILTEGCDLHGDHTQTIPFDFTCKEIIVRAEN